MKTKKWLLLIVSLVVVTSVNAVVIDELGYELNDDTHTAKLVPQIGVKFSGHIDIPSTVSYNSVDYTVVGIGERAFDESDDLEAVTIPNTVSSIATLAFSDCPALADIYVSWTTIQLKGVSVEDYAFLDDEVSSINLHVPAADTTAYKTTSPWKEFHIVVDKTDYTISYDLAGGELETGKTNPEKYDEQTPTFVLYNPLCPYYAFRGWNTEGNTFVAIPTGSSGDLSYTALWQALPEGTWTPNYTLRGIPDGYSVKANQSEVTVLNGQTEAIEPGAELQLFPPAGRKIKNVALSSIVLDLSSVVQPSVIVCGDGDTITGTANGNIMLVIPNGLSIVLRDVNITNDANHPAIFCLGNATFVSEGTAGNAIRSTQVNQPGIQASGKGSTITFNGNANLTVSGGDHVDNIELNGATAVKNMTGTLVGNESVVCPPVPKKLTYTGAAQELICPGYTNGGKLLYSLDNTNWADTVPTQTNAGIYTVYYKVDESGIYSGKGVQSVSVVVEKILGTMYFSSSSRTKDAGSIFTDAVTIVGDGKVVYSSTDPSIASVVDSTGTVTCYHANKSAQIIATVTDGVNYTYLVKTASYDLNINALSATEWPFDYTGSVQQFKAPSAGEYILRVWGAQGGGRAINKGGLGGYATCKVKLNYNDSLFIYVGGKGVDITADSIGRDGGWNGGGKGGDADTSTYAGGAGGGGATHISKINGDIIGNGTGFKKQVDSLNCIIIAGGGGGMGHVNSTPGDGGGKVGGAGKNCSGKEYATNWYHSKDCSYGATAGKAAKKDEARDGSGGGGGGFYGGNAQTDHTAAKDSAGGCGGSAHCNTTIGYEYSTIEKQREGNGYAILNFNE